MGSQELLELRPRCLVVSVSLACPGAEGGQELRSVSQSINTGLCSRSSWKTMCEGGGVGMPRPVLVEGKGGEPQGIASVPGAGLGLTSRRGGAEAAAAVSREALTFRTRDRNSSEDRPAWGRCQAGQGRPQQEEGKTAITIGHFTCVLRKKLRPREVWPCL